MLSRLENKVLISLLSVCKEKGAVLISPIDLLKIIGTEHLTLSKLEKTLNDLSTDGYFDLVYSDRRGEKVFCITLLEKGKGYVRSESLERRNLIKRFVLTIGFAILSFIVGIILKKIF
ncbi:MAG: hypothetical protein E7372_02465 [Clostridiales bacterium]|nr:hypothetical protein [Clostridiales bacterium]